MNMTIAHLGFIMAIIGASLFKSSLEYTLICIRLQLWPTAALWGWNTFLCMFLIVGAAYLMGIV